jgi:hypothetical protein
LRFRKAKSEVFTPTFLDWPTRRASIELILRRFVVKKFITTYEDIKNGAERLSQRIEITDTGCHLYTLGKVGNGYGTIGIGGNSYLTHRVAYLLAHPDEAISRKDYICHSCDTPACINPDHLFKSDCKGNLQDAAAKGRLHSDPKLSDNEVMDLRQRWQAGESMTSLMKDFGIDPRCLVRIVKGEGYKHLPVLARPADFEVDRSHVAPKGVDHYKAKLTDRDVISIRNRYAHGEKQSTLAREYGVDHKNIFFIVHGITWKHLLNAEPLLAAA